MVLSMVKGCLLSLVLSGELHNMRGPIYEEVESNIRPVLISTEVYLHLVFDHHRP